MLTRRCPRALKSCALIFVLLGLSGPGRGENLEGSGKTENPSFTQIGAAQSSLNWVSVPGVIDGLTAYALHWKPERPTGRAVILLWGGWESVSALYTNSIANSLVKKLTESGYSVLAVDPRGARGHGDFYYLLKDIGTDEVSDVISAAFWLKAESAPQVLFLVGISHGGSLALRSAEEFPEYAIPVDGVWAFGAVTDYQAWMDWACIVNDLFRCSLLNHWSSEQRFQGSPIHFVPKPGWPFSLFMRDYLCPVFLVHGTLDMMVPVEQSRAWLKVDPDATLFEQPVDHVGLLNDTSIQKGLLWMNRIAAKKIR